ncbi:unnamed protein product [Prunus armeniaca]
MAQCSEIGHCEALKLRLFPSTLTGAAFSWYVKLPQHSVPNWQVMEQVFHEQFYRPEPEVSMADLAKISQKPSESVQEYLGRFREARARCTGNMPEHEFAKLAQGGLLLDLQKKFEGV